jgi:hypothetical protein
MGRRRPMTAGIAIILPNPSVCLCALCASVLRFKLFTLPSQIHPLHIRILHNLLRRAFRDHASGVQTQHAL